MHAAPAAALMKRWSGAVFFPCPCPNESPNESGSRTGTAASQEPDVKTILCRTSIHRAAVPARGVAVAAHQLWPGMATECTRGPHLSPVHLQEGFTSVGPLYAGPRAVCPRPNCTVIVDDYRKSQCILITLHLMQYPPPVLQLYCSTSGLNGCYCIEDCTQSCSRIENITPLPV